jgi:ribose transport system substrate-binding protein
MRRCVLVVATCVGLAAVAGCGSSDSDSSANGGSGSAGDGAGKAVKIDIGDGKVIATKTTAPKVAFFGTSGNLYLQAYNDGLREVARKNGIKLTVFDAKFDPSRQMEQVQNALQRGGFDAFGVVALDGNTMCRVLTRSVPAQRIPVVTALTPICDRGLKPEGPELWAPGTVAHVQDDSTYTEDQKWVDEIAKRLDKKSTVAMLNSPPLITVAKAFNKAIEYGKAKYPNFDHKYTVTTDQTTPDCLAKTQTLLQAHPDVDVLLSNYSDCTVGAIRAIKAAGRSKSVRLFDVGGSHQSFEAIKAGDLEMTTYHTPRDNGRQAMQAIVDAFQGKKVQRYVGVYPQGITIQTSPLTIDKENVDEYTPQY